MEVKNIGLNVKLPKLAIKELTIVFLLLVKEYDIQNYIIILY